MRFTLDRRQNTAQVEFDGEAEFLAESRANIGRELGAMLHREGMTGTVIVSIVCAGEPVAIFSMTREGDQDAQMLWNMADGDLTSLRPRGGHA